MTQPLQHGATSNAALRVLMGFGSGPYEEFPVWEDVTAYVRSFTVDRGRTTVTDRFEAGTGQIVVQNSDARFDPVNTASPFYPDLRIKVPVAIEIDYLTSTTTIFRGMIEAFPLQYLSAGLHSEVSIPIVDGLPLLVGAPLDGYSYPEQLSGERVHAVLDDAGWPASFRDVDVGGGQLPATTIEGLSAFDHLLEVVDVEAGHFFISADGFATFRSRASSAGLSSSYTLGQTAGDVRYQDLGRSYDDDYLFNVVNATRPEGVTQTAVDDDSIDFNGRSALPIDAPFINDGAALNVAEWQVARLSETVNRITPVVIQPDLDPTNMWPPAVGLELRDGVTVEFQPPGGGSAVNQLSSVEGVHHNYDAAAQTYQTSFDVWPLQEVETTGYWILGVSALDVDARLS